MEAPACPGDSPDIWVLELGLCRGALALSGVIHRLCGSPSSRHASVFRVSQPRGGVSPGRLGLHFPVFPCVHWPFISFFSEESTWILCLFENLKR